MQEFHFSYGQLGVLMGVSNITGGLMQLAFGYLGRFVLRKTMLAGQNLVLALVMGLTGVANAYVPFLATTIAGRIAISPQHPVGNSMVTDIFGKKLRGSAFAINYSGGNVGAVLVPMIATVLIMGIGWRWTMAVFAIPGIVLAALLMRLIDEAKSPVASGERSGGNPLREVFEILNSRIVVLIFLTSIVAAGGRGLGVIMNWVPVYLRNGLNLDASYVGMLFTVLMIGSVVGPLAAGRLSDRLGRWAVLLAAYAWATVSTLVLTLIGAQSWLLPVVIFILGCASYAESPILQTYLADSTRRGSRDLAYGLYFAITALAGSLWASAIGYIVDNQGFTVSFYVMSLSYVVAALLVLPARERQPESSRQN
jgi:MFS family permease